MVSFSQSQYFAAESNNSLTAFVTLSNEASKDMTVEIILIDGSANGILKHNICKQTYSTLMYVHNYIM